MNEFIVEVEKDGKIKVTSPGSFSKEKHLDADEFLAFIEGLAGGDTVVKKLQPNLANPHTHTHGHQHKHTN